MIAASWDLASAAAAASDRPEGSGSSSRSKGEGRDAALPVLPWDGPPVNNATCPLGARHRARSTNFSNARGPPGLGTPQLTPSLPSLPPPPPSNQPTNQPTTNQQPFTVAHGGLQAGAARYFNSGAFSDLVLVAPDGRRLKCHRVVLAVRAGESWRRGAVVVP